jgi:hypothetical protein
VMPETHFAGIITEKRHNFDPSTPPAGTENLHFTLNGQTGGPPGRQMPVPRRLGKTQTRPDNAGAVSPFPVLGKGKACSRGSCTELWTNKACGTKWVLSSPQRSA